VQSPKRKRRVKYNPDSFDINAIETIINNMYLNGLIPNMKDVHEEVKRDLNISLSSCCYNTFSRNMKQLGKF